MSEVKEWRIQHPKARLSEIEIALDERLGRMRARLIETMALALIGGSVGFGDILG